MFLKKTFFGAIKSIPFAIKLINPKYSNMGVTSSNCGKMSYLRAGLF